jgi:hypothetical protein
LYLAAQPTARALEQVLRLDEQQHVADAAGHHTGTSRVVCQVQVKAASESRNGDQGASVLGGNAAYNAKLDEHMKEQQQQLEAAQAALSVAQQAECMIRCVLSPAACLPEVLSSRLCWRAKVGCCLKCAECGQHKQAEFAAYAALQRAQRPSLPPCTGMAAARTTR